MKFVSVLCVVVLIGAVWNAEAQPPPPGGSSGVPPSGSGSGSGPPPSGSGLSGPPASGSGSGMPIPPSGSSGGAGSGGTTTFVVSAPSTEITHYSIEGFSDDNPTINVTAGQTWTFNLTGVASIHPFFITKTDPTASTYEDVSGLTFGDTNRFGNILTWAVSTTDVGQTIFYVCGVHKFFGNINVLAQSTLPTLPPGPILNVTSSSSGTVIIIGTSSSSTAVFIPGGSSTAVGSSSTAIQGSTATSLQYSFVVSVYLAALLSCLLLL